MPGEIFPEAAAVIYDACLPLVGGERAFILGVAGAQGSGKSTVAHDLVDVFRSKGLSAASISLDDFYLTKEERRQRAEDIHPLFGTRGAPGTHDVGLAIATLDAVHAGRTATAPSFDKSVDDRFPAQQSTNLPAGLDVLIFEGWCLGAEPQADAALAAPINDLERDQDSDGAWRRTVNEALGCAYQDLFSRIDFLVFLRAPEFSVVCDWRIEQERALEAEGRAGSGLMNEETISIFVQYFERITRGMLEQTPKRADLTLELDRDRRVTRVRRR